MIRKPIFCEICQIRTFVLCLSYRIHNGSLSMGQVIYENSISLDGYVTGPNDGQEFPLGEGGMRLFDWYNSGDVELQLPGTDMYFKVSRASAELIQEEWPKIGAG